jgi:hypothetical protein
LERLAEALRLLARVLERQERVLQRIERMLLARGTYPQTTGISITSER